MMTDKHKLEDTWTVKLKETNQKFYNQKKNGGTYLEYMMEIRRYE